MLDWWHGLTAVNQGFFVAAWFFSAFFVWQLISAIIGLGGEHSVDDVTSHVDMAGDHGPTDTVADTDAHESILSFKLLSIRSVLAFFTLFTWAGSLYLMLNTPLTRSLLYALLWGLAAMAIVSLLLNMIRKLAETGTPQLATCVGTVGTVHLDVPAGGFGEVRALVSGVFTHL
jgi:hypothetical protein